MRGTRFRITAKSGDGTAQAAVRYTREAAALEMRRQLFHRSRPSVVRVEVDRGKEDVV